MITAELARELKVALLPWQPRRGDVVVDRLNIPYLVLRDGTDDAGGVVIDTGTGVDRKPFLGLTWLPRLDQLLAYLARHAPLQVAVEPGGAVGNVSRWRVSVRPMGEGEVRSFVATDGSEAAGQALHYLLSQTGWRPGRAL